MIFGFFSVFGRNLWNSDNTWWTFSKSRRENWFCLKFVKMSQTVATKICWIAEVGEVQRHVNLIDIFFHFRMPKDPSFQRVFGRYDRLRFRRERLVQKRLSAKTGIEVMNEVLQGMNKVHHKLSTQVWSCPQISSACVEPYNTVLCVHSLLEHTDVTNQVDNEALYGAP